MIKPTCPICSKTLKDGERLAVLFYEPKGWWVTYHLREKTREERIRNPFAIAVFGPDFHIHCQQADIQKVI